MKAGTVQVRSDTSQVKAGRAHLDALHPKRKQAVITWDALNIIESRGGSLGTHYIPSKGGQGSFGVPASQMKAGMADLGRTTSEVKAGRVHLGYSTSQVRAAKVYLGYITSQVAHMECITWK